MKLAKKSIYLGILFMVFPLMAYSGENYVGVKKCGTCHQEEFSSWKRSAHARAFSSLKGKQKKDPKCISCHTLSTEERELEGVQCENCHGPGRYYSVPYVMKDKELSRILGLTDVSEPTCRICHTQGSPSIKEFNYEEFFEKIRHSIKKISTQVKNKKSKEPAQEKIKSNPTKKDKKN